MSLGDGVLKSRGFSNHYWWCWVGIGVLIMGNVIFNIGLIAAHAYLPRESCCCLVLESGCFLTFLGMPARGFCPQEMSRKCCVPK